MIKRKKNNNEIDLIELSLFIWSGKWLMAIVIFTMLLIAFVYAQFVKPNYKVLISYKFTYLKKIEIDEILLSYLDENWKLEANKIILITENPLSADKYTSKFQDLTEKINLKIYNKNQSKLKMIFNEFTENMINTNSISAEILDSKKIMYDLDGGENVVDFSSIKIRDISIKFKNLIFKTIISGFFFSVIILLVRYNLKIR
jgi:LPS O-antigen subunit length determinant protein (WzzB/FepE family)